MDAVALARTRADIKTLEVAEAESKIRMEALCIATQVNEFDSLADLNQLNLLTTAKIMEVAVHHQLRLAKLRLRAKLGEQI